MTRELLKQASQALEKGQLTAALSYLDQIQSPGELHASEQNLRSIVYYRQGNKEEALEVLLRLKSNSGLNPEIEHRIAQIHIDLGDQKEALQILKDGVKLFPTYQSLKLTLALLLKKEKKLVESTSYLQEILVGDPSNQRVLGEIVDSYFRLNRIESGLNKINEAIRSTNNPQRSYSWIISLMQKFGLTQEMLAFMESWRELYPEHYENTLNLGVLYQKQGNYNLANERFNECIEGESIFSVAATIYWSLTKIENECFADDPLVLNKLNSALKEYITNSSINYVIPIFGVFYFDIPRELYLKAVEKVSRITNQSVKHIKPYERVANPGKNLRVGFISSKFRTQSGAFLYYDVFKHFDRERIDLIGYHIHPTSDDFTQRIGVNFDKFRTFSVEPAAQIVNEIRNDNLDVIITTAGYYNDMRMEVLAARVAPTQINSQGYNDTFQANFMDCAFADHIMVNETLAQSYSEKLIFMEPSVMFNSPLPFEPDFTFSRKVLGIEDDTFVFGSIHKPEKITLELLNAWTEILRNTVNSVILIYDSDNEQFRKKIDSYFEKKGLKDRIKFSGHLPIRKHYARYACIDLLLDSFNYNAQATAVESLRMGTPFITLMGNTPNRRMGSSILKAIELDELVVKSYEAYVKLAQDLRNNSSQFRIIKERLEERLQNSPFFDSSLQAKRIEKALLEVLEVR